MVLSEFTKLMNTSYQDKKGKKHSYYSVIALLKKTKSIPAQDKFAMLFSETEFNKFKKNVNDFYEYVQNESLGKGRDSYYYGIYAILLFSKAQAIKALKDPKSWYDISMRDDLPWIPECMNNITLAYKEMKNGIK